MDATNEELVAAYRRGEAGALGALVEQNEGVCAKYARRWRRFAFDDLMQEGRRAVARAAETFDAARGVRFVTYAVHWVRAYQDLWVVKNLGDVRLSTTVGHRRALRAPRTRARLAAAGLPHDDAAVAAALGRCTAQAVAEVAEAMRDHVRLDSDLVNPEDGSVTRLGDALAARLEMTAPSPEELLSERQEAARRRGALEAFLSQLWDESLGHHPPSTRKKRRQEIEILNGRHLCAGEPATLSQVGARLGVSGERVRQVEEALLGRMRAFASAAA